MDRIYYEEMKKNFDTLLQEDTVQRRHIYLFGHCNATEKLAVLFMENNCVVEGILDNNVSKHGTVFKGIPIVSPCEVMKNPGRDTLVCVAARAYAAMSEQLSRIGYKGEIRKMVSYDTYTVYSLSETTVLKMEKRLERGLRHLEKQKKKYRECFRVYCPFSALGDVYYAMSYLQYFLEKKSIRQCVVFTIGSSCADVAEMFGIGYVEALSQIEMDESIQAVLYMGDSGAYVPHQDRPYVAELAKVLQLKKISLEMIYRCGVYGLHQNSMPYKPVRLHKSDYLERILPGKAVILSPYAKSVTSIPDECWRQIIRHYEGKGYQIFTNVSGDEVELEGTLGLKVKLSEMQSVVERAGTFIGIRSGLCDVIREAVCKKIVLYPDCYYSDTRWKMDEIYHLDGFKNIVIR